MLSPAASWRKRSTRATPTTPRSKSTRVTRPLLADPEAKAALLRLMSASEWALIH